MAFASQTRRRFLTLTAIGLAAAMTGCVDSDGGDYPEPHSRPWPVYERYDWGWHNPWDRRWHHRYAQRETYRHEERREEQEHTKGKPWAKGHNGNTGGHEADRRDDERRNGKRQDDGTRRGDQRSRNGSDAQLPDREERHRRAGGSCPSGQRGTEACLSTVEQRRAE